MGHSHSEMVLDEYLETISSGVQRERVRHALTKHVRSSSGLTTEAKIVIDYVNRDGTLKYHSMTGKKRDGMRLPKKPHWSIWAGDRGVEISKIAAVFANWCLGNVYDLKFIEAEVDEQYRREIERAKPSRGWGGPL